MDHFNVSIRMSKEDKEFLQKAAEERGISFSELVREGAKIWASLDLSIIKKIEKLAALFDDVPKYLIIQNKFIKSEAQDLAHREIWSEFIGTRSSRETLSEFQFRLTAKKDERWEMLTGDDLLEFLKRIYIQEYREHLEDLLPREIRNIGTASTEKKIEAIKFWEEYQEERRKELLKSGMSEEETFENNMFLNLYNECMKIECLKGREAALEYKEQYLKIYETEGWSAANKFSWKTLRPEIYRAVRAEQEKQRKAAEDRNKKK